MSLSYTYEEVKNKFEQIGYTLLSKNYKNCKEKLLCLDDKGYKILISFDKLLNRDVNGSRFHPSNPYTIENINHYAELNGLTSRCVSKEYINAKESLDFICDCGEHFHTNWSNFSSRHKIKCDSCTNNPRNREYNDIKDNLIKFGYCLDVEESQYLGVTLTPLICYDKYGYKYKVTYDAKR